ncbi:MAG: hypothetical protein ACOCZ5_03070 [bacterium]
MELGLILAIYFGWLVMCFPMFIVIDLVIFESDIFDKLTVIGKIIVWIFVAATILPVTLILLLVFVIKLLLYPIYCIMIKKENRYEFFDYLKFNKG